MSTSDMLHPRIAYVEMESDIRDIIIKGLQKYGFVVNGYDSAESFRSEFKAGLYDLIISGTHLTKMKGSVELYRNVKRIDPKQRYLFVSVCELCREKFGNRFPDSDCRFLMLPTTGEIVSEINNILGISLRGAE